MQYIGLIILLTKLLRVKLTTRPLSGFEPKQQLEIEIYVKSLFTGTWGSELPQGNDCPGASVTLGSHDDFLSRGNITLVQLHCPGANSASSVHYEFI